MVNGDSADVFIVFAETEAINDVGLKQIKPSAFFVERHFGGVTSKPRNTLGLQETDISDVMFEDTPIPAGNEK